MKKTGKNKSKPTLGKVFPHKVTFDPVDEYQGDDHEEITGLIEKYHFECRNSSPKTITELQELIRKYPHIREFYNFLACAFDSAGQTDESIKLIHQTLELFPDYLFAKVSLAGHLLKSGELEKIPELFNNKFDLKELYPDRSVFHISEVRCILVFMAFYNLQLRNFGAAERYASQLESVDPDDPILDKLKVNINMTKMLGMLEKKIMN